MKLVNPDTDVDFRESPYADIIQKSCPKNVTISDMGKISFHVRLTSRTELKVPGRALRTFSVNLVRHPAFHNLLWNGHLFKTSPTASLEEAPEQEDSIDPETISDTEFLQALVAYFLRKTDPDSAVYRKKRDAVLLMKKIALEAGMIRKDDRK